MPDQKRENLKAWGILLLLSLIWGSSFILIKRGLEVFSAPEVAAIRIVSAATFLLPLALPRMGKITTRHYRLLFIIGLVGSFFPAFFFALAQTSLSSSVTGILNALTPISTLVIGAAFFSQPITRQKGIGLGMGLTGTIILVLAGSGGQLGAVNAFAGFVIGATICYGTNLNVIKTFLADLKPTLITSISLVLVAPFAAIYLFGFSGFIQTLQNTEGAGISLTYLLILGVVGTALSLIIFNHLVQMKTAVFASSVTYLIPVVAIGWGLLDGEELLVTHFIGMVTVISGVYLANKRRQVNYSK